MKKSINSFALIIFIAIIVFQSNVFSQDVEPIPVDIPDGEASIDAQKRRLEAFEIVWQTINDNYFDRTFSGLDWKKIKAEYQPQVIKAKTDGELHLILQKMISRLNRSHFGIIPPDVFVAIEKAKEESAKQSLEITEELSEDEDSDELKEVEIEELDSNQLFTKYGIGIELRLFKDKFVITEVEKNSSAQKAGLKTGYIIEAINGVLLNEFLEAIRPEYLNVKSFDKKIPAQVVEWFLDGEKDTFVQVSVLDETDKPKNFTIKRERISGEFVTILSSVPDQYLRFDTKSINQDIGYVKFNFFALPIIEKFCSAITEFKDKKALIIDLRGNKGGLLGSLMGVSSFLTNKKINLGTEINRQETIAREISPHAKTFKGKTYILIDGLSYSAAEMFAAAMQENDLATIIGEISAGEALPSLTKNLPTGAVFLFPVANFKTPKGNFLEGKGVNPDFEVALKRENLLNGKDDQLDVAIDIATGRIKKAALTEKNSAGIGDKKRLAPPPPRVSTNRTRPTSNVRKLQQIKALKVIDEFIEASGGQAELEKIVDYQANGSLEITRAGAVVEGTIEILWMSPNKYSDNYYISGVGKISEVFDGKEFFVESEFTGSDNFYQPKALEDKALSMGFYEILKMRENYPRIVHRGVFTVEGRKVNLIEATTASGVINAFNFDVETKMLVKRVSNYTGIVEYDNYKKVNDKILLPFTIKKGIYLIFKLDEYLLNVELDESSFAKKESCFDKID